MTDPSTTPQKAPGPEQRPSAPPPAPLKPAQAWAQFRDGMRTMPLDQARALKPRDIGVQLGPIMTEAQFEEYRKSRHVKIMK